MSFQIGTIYEIRTEDACMPTGTRVEFIGGAEDDLFCDGTQVEWFVEGEVVRSPDQSPIEYNKAMEAIKAKGLAGYDVI